MGRGNTNFSKDQKKREEKKKKDEILRVSIYFGLQPAGRTAQDLGAPRVKIGGIKHRQK